MGARKSLVMPNTPSRAPPLDLGEPLPLHNGQGYVKFIESWGSDERIVESARMSTGKGFLGWEPREGAPRGDNALLEYMYANRHSTPFEMAGMTVDFEVPIFVIRQVHRHRSFGYSELSARYTELPDTLWLPRADQVRKQDKKDRQATFELVEDHVARNFIAELESAYEHTTSVYQRALRANIAREQARCVMSVANFTRCRMTGNLRNWLHFSGLRLEGHAQAEVRVELGEHVARFLTHKFPRTWDLFLEYDLHGDRLSATQAAEQRAWKSSPEYAAWKARVA